MLRALKDIFDSFASQGDEQSPAQLEAKTIYDYQRFTGLLNDHFSQDRKIAGLLHVTHGQYIGAKMRAKAAAKI